FWDLVRIGFSVELFLICGVRHEAETLHAGRRLTVSVGSEDAAPGEALFGALREDAPDPGLRSLAGPQIEDVDERVGLSGPVGVANRERSVREDEVDLPKSIVAALHPGLETDRRVGSPFPGATLEGRARRSALLFCDRGHRDRERQREEKRSTLHR